MKKYILITGCYILVSVTPAWTQGIKIMPGTTFNQTGGTTYIVLADNAGFENNAALTSTALVLKGSGNGNTEIKGTDPLTVQQLHVNKTSGQMVLQKDVTVANGVSFGSGLLDLNEHNLFLASTANLQNESEASRITGPLGGTVQITQDLNAPLAVNPGNMGIVISSGANLGTTTVKRSHKINTNLFGGSSIARSYEIMPANNNGLAAQLRAYYFDAETNTLDENTFEFYRSGNGGYDWQGIGAVSRDATLNFVNISNLSTMAMYTLSNAGNALHANSSSKGINRFVLLQNPVVSTLIIAAQSDGSMILNAAVYDMAGRSVIARQVNVTDGNSKLSIDINTLPTGNYVLTFADKDRQVWQSKFVKQ